ncbi:hypothetical protein B0H11DRAFT_1916101 [Mycena galericulata]|nr:hypothetical protein B0H11DRAFT_1916101 [Mycena galericulata]
MSENSTNGLTEAPLKYQRTRSRTAESVNACARAPSGLSVIRSVLEAESPAAEAGGLDESLDVDDSVAVAEPHTAATTPVLSIVDIANGPPAEAGGLEEANEKIESLKCTHIGDARTSVLENSVRRAISPQTKSLGKASPVAHRGSSENEDEQQDPPAQEDQLLNDGQNDWPLTAEHTRDSTVCTSLPSVPMSAKALVRAPQLPRDSMNAEVGSAALCKSSAAELLVCADLSQNDLTKVQQVCGVLKAEGLEERQNEVTKESRKDDAPLEPFPASSKVEQSAQSLAFTPGGLLPIDVYNARAPAGCDLAESLRPIILAPQALARTIFKRFARKRRTDLRDDYEYGQGSPSF